MELRPPRWRVTNVGLTQELDAQEVKLSHRPRLRRAWALFRPVAFIVLLVVQPIAGMMLLGVTLSMASLFTGPPPATAFWIAATILALVNALASAGAWTDVVEKARSRVLDPHAILIAAGLTLGFAVAALWVWAKMFPVR